MAGSWSVSSAISKAAANGIIGSLNHCYYELNSGFYNADISAVLDYVEGQVDCAINCTITIPAQEEEGIVTMLSVYDNNDNPLFFYSDNIPIPAGETPTVVNFKIPVKLEWDH